MHMNVLSVCLSWGMQCLQRPEEGIGSFRTGISDGCEPSCGRWEWENLHPLEEQPVLSMHWAICPAPRQHFLYARNYSVSLSLSLIQSHLNAMLRLRYKAACGTARSRTQWGIRGWIICTASHAPLRANPSSVPLDTMDALCDKWSVTAMYGVFSVWLQFAARHFVRIWLRVRPVKLLAYVVMRDSARSDRCLDTGILPGQAGLLLAFRKLQVLLFKSAV